MHRQHLVIFFACFDSLFCDLSTKSFMLLLGFKNIRKSLIKKFIQGKDVTVTNVLSCYGHVSIKKQIIFHWITTLCPYWNYWCLQKINWNEKMNIVIEKKLEACVKTKVQKKMDNFFLKEFKKEYRNHWTRAKYKLKISSKKIISPEPLAFKCFATTTMTQNPASVSHLACTNNKKYDAEFTIKE